jgi:branched-chain amino acid transport system substrate-binding protein
MKSSYLAILFSTLVAYSQISFAQTLKIVSSLPRTGSSNTMTGDVVNGIRLAIEERGGKAGKFSIVYEDWDDASPERGNWDPAIEASNADKAIQDKSVVAYIIYNSGATKISQPKLNLAGVAQLGFATWPGLTKPGLGEPNEPSIYRTSGKPGYFRLVPADDLQGSVAAKWAFNNGAKKAYAIHDKELYGKGLAGIFEKTAVSLGMQVLGNEGIDAKSSNYRSLATKIRAVNPDVIFIGATTQSNSGQVVKDLRAVGIKAKIIGPDGCFEQAFIDAIGKGSATNDVYVTFGGLPADKLTGKGAEFVAKFKSKYNKIPEAYASYGYETTLVILDAIARANTEDRLKIREAIASTTNFEGLLGKWSFDQNGDTTQAIISINKIKDGKFEFLDQIQ